MTAAIHVLEWNLWGYRRTWRGSLFSTFLSPVLFLAAMGVGLGAFVDQGGGSAALGGVTYAAFLAPGLLAGQAMQTAGFESTYPIMSGIVWDRTYHGMLATPVTVPSIVLGQLAWIGLRLTLVATVFFGVMVVFGLVAAPSGVLAVPVAILTGLAFAAPIVAFAATQRNDQGFSAVFRFGLTPMFLFSGTFFPIDRLPGALQLVAELLPLHHGVALARHLCLGDPASAAEQLLHVGVLTTYVVVGVALALVTFRRALVK